MMQTRTCLILLLFVGLSQAVPLGTGFTYQGELKKLGAPANGPFDFQFELFDVDTGGTAVATPVPVGDVAVVDGVFTVELDFGSFNGDQLWLEVAVRDGASTGAYTNLSPRQKITAVPYALSALNDADNQDLELSGNTLSLTNDGTSVDLSAYLDNTDDQTLTDVLGQSNDAGNQSLVNIGNLEAGSLELSGGGDLLQTPGNPRLVGSLELLGLGFPFSMHVSGRYAYVVGIGIFFDVIDVSDPSAPSLIGSLSIGDAPVSVYVSGRYAYVIDISSNDLKVIDVSDPSAPILVGLVALGTNPGLVYVAGRYAYVIDFQRKDFVVIDISGAEFTSVIAHSLETGNVQVRNDIIAQGQLQVTGGINVGAGGIFSDGDVGVGGDMAITGDLSVTGMCSGCASDINLKQDIQPLSGALDKISQLNGVSYVWNEYVREAKQYPGQQIGVLGQDVEAVFPELVGTDSRGYKFVHYQKLVAPLIEAVKELKVENNALKADNQAMKHQNEAMMRRDEEMERRMQSLESRLN